MRSITPAVLGGRKANLVTYKLGAVKSKKKKKKKKKYSGLLLILFIFFVLRKRKEKKTHSSFFFLFTVQSSCCVGDLFSCGLWNLSVVPCSGIEPRFPALGTRSLSPWIIREIPMSFLNRFLFFGSVQFSSVAQLCLTLRPHEPQHARPPCPSPIPGVHPNPC